jgi:uncharacterized protein (TIGR02246 family)
MLAHTPEAVHAVLEDAFNRADLDALVALLEPGATMVVPPEGHAVNGREAIRAALAPVFARHPRLTSEVVRRVQADGLAMTHARWRLVQLDDEGDPVEVRGHGTVVSRLQRNGTWRIVLDNPLTPD